ncbi:MAG: sporulation protein [Oscillospiraceae bacterium]|nr:sporulation protein [Oscillospiraceae bacterium]
MNEKLPGLLYSLGLSANYTGFYCIISAVEIASREPQSLTMVTKWLYPQIAKQRGTNWKAVERNIRSAIDIIWKRNPLGLQQLSSCQMDSKPATAQFISLLMFYLQFDAS